MKTIEDAKFIQKCAIRRDDLPLLPCDCNLCEWYIHDTGSNCCFWVLATKLDKKGGLSFEEIAKLENITVSEVEHTFNNAIRKIRNYAKELELIQEN